MPILNVTDAAGETKNIEAAEGLSLMEVLRDAGYPIAGACNGSVACATCHVVIAPEWADKVSEISEKEEDILDTAINLEGTSRLCCQIIMKEELSGLVLRIPS